VRACEIVYDKVTDRLLAFCQPNVQQSLFIPTTLDDIVEYSQTVLLQWCRPDKFYIVNELPLTKHGICLPYFVMLFSGKVDRSTLLRQYTDSTNERNFMEINVLNIRQIICVRVLLFIFSSFTLLLQTELGVPLETISTKIDSLSAVRCVDALRKQFTDDDNYDYAQLYSTLLYNGEQVDIDMLCNNVMDVLLNILDNGLLILHVFFVFNSF
jgi:hypothetical protein